LGLLTTVLGSALGGLMIRATPAQAEEMRLHHPVKAVGAHTIGAPDGGPGIPGVGWSTEHGDGRIPHFFGIHGLQIIPFLGWLLSRRRDVGRVKLIFAIAASYLAFVAILAWQAMRGQSVLEPDPGTLLAFAIWLVAALGTVLALRKAPVEALA
jgi:hypothetical protein